MRRAAALWLVLFGAYAATIGLHAFGSSDYGGDEPHYLLAAESLRDDGDIDVADEYRAKTYDKFYPYPLDRHGSETDGRLNEPHGVGFPLLILPAYALGGAKGVELFLAAVAALALVLGYRLALRVTPDPWAVGATLAVGLSPPFLAYGSAVYPELTAAAALAAAALLTLGPGEQPSRRRAFSCFALLGLLPWLGTKFALAGAVVGFVAARALWRSRRRVLTVGVVELALFSVAMLVAINEALYGGPTPYSADLPRESATDAAFPGGYLTGPTAWWRSSSTARTGCCAGRRCSRSRSRGSGGCGARTATACPVRSLLSAGPSLRRGCAGRSWARNCWWPACSPRPCSASGSRPGT